MLITNQTEFLDFNIIEFDCVDSTMIESKKFLVNSVIVARQQLNGRGKGNRVWVSEKNNNLYFSLKIKADKKRLDYSQLSFLCGLAMKNAIEKYDKNNNLINLKWPNDILINGKKVCGILLEFDYLLKELIIGIGVNIDSFPQTNTIFNATSLLNEKINADRILLLKDFLFNFKILLEQWIQNGFSFIREQWLKGAFRLGEKIKVKDVEGIFEDLDNDGTLILNTENGILKIKSGDVFV